MATRDDGVMHRRDPVGMCLFSSMTVIPSYVQVIFQLSTGMHSQGSQFQKVAYIREMLLVFAPVYFPQLVTKRPCFGCFRSILIQVNPLTRRSRLNLHRFDKG